MFVSIIFKYVHNNMVKSYVLKYVNKNMANIQQ